MKTFLTEYTRDGDTLAGPNIIAESLEEAQSKAAPQHRVLGELISSQEVSYEMESDIRSYVTPTTLKH